MALPTGQTRLQIANSILTTLRDQNVPEVYGFINAAKLEKNPDDIAVLKAWRAAGQPLGSHTYSHPPSTTSRQPSSRRRSPGMSLALLSWQDRTGIGSAIPSFGRAILSKNVGSRAYLQQNGYKVAQVSLDFEDYLWNAPYARCVDMHDDKAIETLRTTYLSTADQYITIFRDVTHTLYGRDIPYVLLLHIGAFDAKMLPDLIVLLPAAALPSHHSPRR